MSTRGPAVRLRFGGTSRVNYYEDIASPYSVAGGELVGAPQIAEVASRIARARTLYDDLGRLLAAFFDSVVPTFRTAHDPISGMSTLMMRVADLPAESSLVVSDIVHHLRSSLDNLLFILLRGDELSPRDQRKIQFPIANAQADFPANIDKGRLFGAAPALVAAVRSVQPFVSTNDVSRRLALLDDVSRFDKHRFLHFGVAHATNELSPHSVVATPLDPYESYLEVRVFNEGAEVSEIPVTAVIAVPHESRFDLALGTDHVFDFTAVFGYSKRFLYAELAEMTDAVELLCDDLWSQFGT